MNCKNIRVVPKNYNELPKHKYVISFGYNSFWNNETLLVSAIDVNDALQIGKLKKPNQRIAGIMKQ